MKIHIQHIYSLGRVILGMQVSYAEQLKKDKGFKDTERGKKSNELLERLRECYTGLLTIDNENQQLKLRVDELAKENIEQGKWLVELNKKNEVLQNTLNQLAE